MPHPHVVLAVSDGTSAMLYRYAADGTFAGDTWHESLEEAKAAAEEEYGLALQAWREVPADVTDAHAYAIANASGDG